MRKTFALLMIAVVVAGVGAVIRASRATPSETKLPGTGVAIVLPKGVKLDPLGTTYADESRTTILAISVGRAKNNAANDPKMLALYPEPIEELHSPNLSGTIHKRTRGRDGGGWDGWWLNAVKGDYVLDVKINYSGTDGAEFEKLKENLSTVSWDGLLGDLETAFGLKLDIPGMKLSRFGAGGLLYTADGQVEWKQSNLLLVAVPRIAAGDMESFHKMCDALAARMVAGKATPSLRYQAEHGINVCDVSGGATPFGQFYTAMVMLPQRGVFAATGTGDPRVYQRALLELHRIDR